MRKTVYLVRHAESEGNIGLIQQTPESPLSPTGIKQAKEIAKRIARIKFDTLVSSPHTRTMQTAVSISEATGKKIMENELFIERVKPSEQFGKHKDHNLESEKLYLDAWIKGDRYKDGENFHDLVARARKALIFLESLPGESIVVVTHGIFLRILGAVLLLGEDIEPKTCNRVILVTKTTNTGVTVIEKDSELGDYWRLRTWNDETHLA